MKFSKLLSNPFLPNIIPAVGKGLKWIKWYTKVTMINLLRYNHASSHVQMTFVEPLKRLRRT